MSNDVDEEVYADDGDEVPDAREASYGDRRAIADADQAEQLAISGEMRTPRVLRTPKPPTERMLQHTNSRTISRLVPIAFSKSHERLYTQASVGEDKEHFRSSRQISCHTCCRGEQNTAMHHVRGSTQWRGDQLHVRKERSVFGKSVFAMIPDHEVRPAKLTNRWISGRQRRRDGSSNEHLLGTSGAVVKRLRRVTRSGILMWKKTLEYRLRWKEDDRRRFRQHLHLNLRHNMTVKDLCCEVKECTRKHSESELPGLKSAELQDVLRARLLVGRSHIPVSANYCKMSGKRVDARRQRRRCNVVLLRTLTRKH